MSDGAKSFEEIKERLDQIVEDVSRDDINLDDALALYEEAVKLGLAACDASELGIEEEADGESGSEAEADDAAEVDDAAEAGFEADAVAEAGAGAIADASAGVETESEAFHGQNSTEAEETF